MVSSQWKLIEGLSQGRMILSLLTSNPFEHNLLRFNNVACSHRKNPNEKEKGLLLFVLFFFFLHGNLFLNHCDL